MADDEVLRMLLAQMEAMRVELARLTAGAAPRAPAVDARTFADLWVLFAAWASENHASWQAAGRTHGEHLLPFFGPVPWQECNHAKADEYVARRRTEYVRFRARRQLTEEKRRTVSDQTIAHELASAKRMFNWCVKRWHIDKNPLDRYWFEFAKNTPREGSDVVIAEEDFVRILEHMPVTGQLMLMLALETGMSRDEFRLLERSEVDDSANVIRLPAHRTKVRRARTVDLSEVAVAVIAHARRLRRALGAEGKYLFPHPFASISDESKEQGAVSKSTLYSWFGSAREAAGVKGPTSQSVWIQALRRPRGTSGIAAARLLKFVSDCGANSK